MATCIAGVLSVGAPGSTAIAAPTLVSGPAMMPYLSGNGRFLAVTSFTSLTGDDLGAGVFRIDLTTGAATRVQTPSGQENHEYQGNAEYPPAISADGSRVLLASFPPPPNNSGAMSLVVDDPNSDSATQAYSGLIGSAFSADGSTVAVRAGEEGTLKLLAASGGSERTLTTSADVSFQSEAPRFRLALSANGNLVAFASREILTPNANPNEHENNVYVAAASTGALRLASSDSSGQALSGNSIAGVGDRASISDDGRYVAFEALTYLTELGPPVPVAYVKDMQTGWLRPVSVTPSGSVVEEDSSTVPVISGNGQFVAFASSDPELAHEAGAGQGSNIYLLDLQTGNVGVLVPAALPIATDTLTLSEDGLTAAFERDPMGGVYVVHSQPPGRACPAAQGPPIRLPLDPIEAAVGHDEELTDLRVFAAQIVQAVHEQLSRARRSQRARRDELRAVAQLKAELREVRHDLLSIARHAVVAQELSASQQQQKLLLARSECLLDQAKESLTNFIDEEKAVSTNNKAAAKVLVGTLSDLGKVLGRDHAPGDPADVELVKANVTGLVSFYANANAGKLTEKIATLVQVLSGHLKEEQLSTTLTSQIQDLATKVGGENAGELARQLLLLREVLAGSPSDDKRYELLKQSVLALAKQLVGRDLLSTPQVRAAMLGFELGQAFAKPLEEDLNLIRNGTLERECVLALAFAQHLGHSVGEVDYARKMAVFITTEAIPGTSFAGYQCIIHPEAHVSSDEAGQGVVEAYAPVKLFLGFHFSGGNSIFFDPLFVS